MTRRTRIKICGITREIDAIAAVEAGVDAIGVVMVPASPRVIAASIARSVFSSIPAFVTRVALFANESAENVERICCDISPDLVQFHGGESVAFCHALGRPYVKAWRVTPEMGQVDLLESCESFMADSTSAENLGTGLCRGLLFDAPATANFAGHGTPFDWSLLPTEIRARAMVAGALTPENVGRLVRELRPYAIDVSSGVESAPGIKDHQRIRQFIEAVREADFNADV